MSWIYAEKVKESKAYAPMVCANGFLELTSRHTVPKWGKVITVSLVSHDGKTKTNHYCEKCGLEVLTKYNKDGTRR